jgi:DNA-binding transcriptional LysR family regulator
LRVTLIDLKRRFPDIDLSLVERPHSDPINALCTGAVDLAVFADEKQIVESELMSLWNERILVALPDGHRLSKRDAIYWTDLRTETMILSLDDRGRTPLHKCGLEPVEARTNISLPAALEAAAAGRRVMLGPDPIVWDATAAGGLVIPLRTVNVSAGAFFVIH